MLYQEMSKPTINGANLLQAIILAICKVNKKVLIQAQHLKVVCRTITLLGGWGRVGGGREYVKIDSGILLGLCLCQ